MIDAKTKSMVVKYAVILLVVVGGLLVFYSTLVLVSTVAGNQLS